MYYDDHVPPHFHAYYAEFEGMIEIGNARLLEGQLPNKALALVSEWALQHRNELSENWELALQHQPLNKINPLEKAMIRVTSVMALEGYSLDVTFTDSTRGIVSLADRLFGPMFEPLRDPTFFAKVTTDEFGAVCWPNGADLAPDAMFEQVRSGLRVT